MMIIINYSINIDSIVIAIINTNINISSSIIIRRALARRVAAVAAAAVPNQ